MARARARFSLPGERHLVAHRVAARQRPLCTRLSEEDLVPHGVAARQDERRHLRCNTHRTSGAPPCSPNHCSLCTPRSLFGLVLGIGQPPPAEVAFVVHDDQHDDTGDQRSGDQHRSDQHNVAFDKLQEEVDRRIGSESGQRPSRSFLFLSTTVTRQRLERLNRACLDDGNLVLSAVGERAQRQRRVSSRCRAAAAHAQ
eukprot:scaffold122770_cov108-Phaeocystis_antarctica.AAC.2